MMLLLLSTMAYSLEPCKDAITGESLERMWEETPLGIVIHDHLDGSWLRTAAHCGPVSIRSADVPSWGVSLYPGESAVKGGTGAGMGLILDPKSITVPLDDALDGYLALTMTSGLKVRIHED